MRVAGKMKRITHFDGFELDLQTGELYKEGQKIPLAEKPFQVLVLLLEQPGEMISREEVRRRLWPTGIHVDFDHNLNTTIGKLRRALSDSSENPNLIETVASRGYRFIGHIVANKENSEPSPSEQFKIQTGKIRLAVLPFETLCPEPQAIWLGDGLTEEIIARLGHLFPERLGVIARTTTRKYRGTTKDIGQIGRELKVEYILEGSARCLGDGIRITAQLGRVSDQTHFWAESYEYGMCDVVKVHNEVAERIAQSLGSKFFQGEKASCVRRGISSPEASLLYLKGCYHQAKRTEGDLRASVDFFKQAIQADPTCAQAYSALANSLSFLAGIGAGPPRDFFPQAMEAAQKAFDLNDGLSESNTSLASIKFLYEWNWEGAERLFRRAVDLNPSYWLAHYRYSYYLSSRERHEEALLESQRAYELDSMSLCAITAVGISHYLAREYDNAIEVFQDALDMESTFGPALMWLGAAYSQKSFHDEAILTLKKAKARHPEDIRTLAWLAKAHAAAGKRKEADKLLTELETISKQRYVSPFNFAFVHAGLGQTDLAFEWLEKAYEERSPSLTVFLRVDANFDNLRADQRYECLNHRIQTG